MDGFAWGHLLNSKKTGNVTILIEVSVFTVNFFINT